MAIIPGVLTEDGARLWLRLFGGLQGVPASSTTVTAPGPVTVQWDPRLKFFRVGEGGWVDPGTGRVARTPDPALRRLAAPLIQDLDCLVDPTRAVPAQRYEGNPANPDFSRGNFQKAFVVGDITYEVGPPRAIRIRCLLDFADFNEDWPGSGRNPEIWEVGIYSDHPEIVTPTSDLLMVAYGTFPMQTKTAVKQIENIVRITG